MFPCDRCRLLFNALERVIRRDSDGLVKIDTRLCPTCLYLTGFLSVSSRVEELSTVLITVTTELP
jgi:hypothetical protein